MPIDIIKNFHFSSQHPEPVLYSISVNMRSPCKIPILSTLLFTIFSCSFGRDIIYPGQSLAYGEKLVSADGTFALGFFSPKNSTNKYIGIWHNNVTDPIVVWVANRQSPITSNATRLTISPSGTLAITNHNSTVIWSVASSTISGNPFAQLLDTGNFVVRAAESISVSGFGWQSFDYPTDTLLPGMRLGWDLKTGRSVNLTSWKSESDPSPGSYCLTIDKDGGHELTQLDGSKYDWRSGMWNGIEFSAIIDLKTSGDYLLTFVNNTDEVYISYQMADPSNLDRILMNYTGHTDRYVWLDNYNLWILILSIPSRRCHPYNICGPYGYCDSSALPVCKCFDGFVPKSPGDWAVSNTSAGCVRKTALTCPNGTDGFMKMANMVPPDTLTAVIDSSMSLGSCQAACLRNCSCRGYANSDVRGGAIGCVMWGADLIDMQLLQGAGAGQDLYIRRSDLPMESSVSKLNKKRKTTISVTLSIVLGFLLLSCVIYLMWRKKKTIKEESWNEGEDLELPLYDLDVIIAATDNFSIENKLGEGGFGPVYKGKLPEGQEIAVKRLSKTSNQGVDEFKNEILLIAKLQHRNLVRLLGCCMRGEDRMLIYEYMPNKSLDSFLFDKAESINLSWGMRFNIIVGIARGLLYLHQDSRFRIIHRDLKASNVLLDGEMNPKISDFGLSRIFGAEEAVARTRRVVGTYGYMSPEYAMDGIFSVKSDVFSFGVLVLEIVSGQRTKAVFLSDPEDNLLRKAWRLWSEGKGLELVDPAIGSDFSSEEVIRCIKIGLLCVQESPIARPKMSLVVHMLSDHEGASFFEPQKPGFTAKSELSQPSSSSTNQSSPSINAITFSLDVGR